MAPLIELYFAPDSVTHGAVVWDNTDGGPVRIAGTFTQNVVSAFVAGDFQTSDVAITNETFEMLIDLSQFTPDTLPARNAENSLVFAMKKSDGTNASVTLYRMKYVGLTNIEQGRDSVSSSAARFVYSAGGTEKDVFTA